MQQQRMPVPRARSPGSRSDAQARQSCAGAATGLYSGFLGLGGGFVLVPLLTRWLRYPIKCAIGTSLVAIAILAVPGAITHVVIGNVDWAIAAGLTIGAIPGAVVGSRIGLGASDRALRLGFASLLALTGLWLAASELVLARV